MKKNYVKPLAKVKEIEMENLMNVGGSTESGTTIVDPGKEGDPNDADAKQNTFNSWSED